MRPKLSLLLWLAALLALLLPTLTWAHEVREQVHPPQATLVQLSYADDEPFAFERYELFAEGVERPVQTGLTDAKGRVVFLADGQPHWRLRSFSSDGHGVDFRFEVQADATTAATVAAPASAPGRLPRIALGLAAIAALYGMLRWWLRRRKRKPPAP